MLSTLKFSSAVAPAAVGASLRSPLAIRGRRALAADDRPAQPPTQPPQRWIFPSSVGWLPAAVAEGDSRKTTEQEKDKLLAPAAVGGFAPLAAGHTGEESPRR